MFVYVDIDDHAPTRLIIERLVLIMKAYGPATMANTEENSYLEYLLIP